MKTKYLLVETSFGSTFYVTFDPIREVNEIRITGKELADTTNDMLKVEDANEALIALLGDEDIIIKVDPPTWEGNLHIRGYSEFLKEEIDIKGLGLYPEIDGHIFEDELITDVQEIPIENTSS